MKTTKTRLAVVCLALCLIPLVGGAHSVPTHENITKAAVGWLLAAQPRLSCNDSGKTVLTNALLYGTRHEDDNYDDASPLEMGRYMFHFYPALDDQFVAIQIAPEVAGIQIPVTTVDIGIFKTVNSCSSLEWGGFRRTTPGSVTCSYDALRALNAPVALKKSISMTNVNTWGNALADAGKSNSQFSGFSEGFVKLGYLMHLVEDQSSPAHALGASHGHKTFPIDVLGAFDHNRKGVVDLGFPDFMEVNLAGEDEVRDVPQAAWPARDPSALFAGSAADILEEMHRVTIGHGYKREKMSERSARMFANVRRIVEPQVEAVAKRIGIPWPIGKETAVEEVERLLREIGTIVQEEVQREAVAEMKAGFKGTLATDSEWQALRPDVVRLTGSLLWKYINEAKPLMGSGTASCTLKP